MPAPSTRPSTITSTDSPGGRALATNGAVPWHALDAEGALAEAASAPDGLTTREAQQRLAIHGPNVIERASREGPLHLIWRQINNPLVWVLIAAAALAIVMGKGLDGLVVLAVVVLNTVIGFVQEYRAGKAIEALLDLVPDTATVLRDGARATVPASDLVPGDVVLVASGDKVPADMRLLAARTLRIEEAALTGESVPAEKSLAAVAPEAALGDRRNMAYSGTLVTYGTGTALVVGTGSGTELGRISAMLRETTRLETPLTRSLATVGRWLTVAIMIVSVLLFVVGLLRGYPLIDAILAAITLAVAAIPEGLPAIITIALAIGVQRMAQRRAVIRHLPAVETLGSTTVICSDKTGTLTRNEMTVQALWTPRSGAYAVTGVGYAPAGVLERDGAVLGGLPDDVRELLVAGVLCNDAHLREEDGVWRISGDPTEGALVVAAQKVGVEPEHLRQHWPREDAIPFESELQYMATLNATPEGGRAIYLKGAPEVVLQRCERTDDDAPVDAAVALAEVERLAAAGMRVLALAARRAPEHAEALEPSDADGGFTLLGLQGMIDPPRPEAIAAVQACKRAGIDVKMITGDHAGTARAIGQQLGLLTDGQAVTGVQLAAMSDGDLRATVADGNVFARVAPEHKLRLVRALQANGEVAAMTGDGVNDAPALKQANIGVAMGITGTAVSKEAADIVLTDDNFASIAAAVEEGRRVYDNLTKSLAFVLPTNLGEALIILLAVLFFPIVNGEPLLPMLPTQILWINLVATVALALPLAFEAMEPDVMRRPPRSPSAPILGSFVLVRTAIVALLMTAGAIGLFLVQYYGEVARGVAPEVALREAQTMAVTTVVLFQVFYLLHCRSLRDGLFATGVWSNRSIYLGIAVLVVLQLGFVYLPFMHALFGSAPLGLESWIESTLAALIVLPVISIEKWWRQRRHRQAAPGARAA